MRQCWHQHRRNGTAKAGPKRHLLYLLVAFSVIFEAVPAHAARFCPDGDTLALALLALPGPGFDRVWHADLMRQCLAYVQ
jgi:hypothetical protein